MSFLSFVGENLGNEGAFMVADKLYLDRGDVTGLVLSGCNIGDEGAFKIINAFKQNPLTAVTHLDLSNNNLGDSFTLSLVEFLTSDNCKILRLDISSNNISEQGMEILLTVFAVRPNIALEFGDQKPLADIDPLAGLVVVGEQDNTHATGSIEAGWFEEVDTKKAIDASLQGMEAAAALPEPKAMVAVVAPKTPSDVYNEFAHPTHFVWAYELAVLAHRIICHYPQVTFAALDGNIYESIKGFLGEDSTQSCTTRIAAINISGDGQPCGPEQGNHWVAYVEYRSQDGMMHGLILNSAFEHHYTEAMAKLVYYISDHYQVVDLHIEHLELQSDGRPSCGLWLLEIVEQVCANISVGIENLFCILPSMLAAYDNPPLYIQEKREAAAKIMQSFSNHAEKVPLPYTVASKDEYTGGNWELTQEEVSNIAPAGANDLEKMDHDGST